MAGNIAKAKELAGQGGLNVQQIARRADISPTRAEKIIERTPAKPTTPSYTGALAQFAAPEGFGAGAAMRARAAGFSDAQIKAGVEELRGQGMAIGKRVDIGLNPQQYGNEMAVRGAQQGGFTDAGSGQQYGMRAIYLPEDLKSVGGGLGVVWAAGPGTDQQIIDMYRGKPRESWVLPASTSAPDQPYTPPAGVNAINPLASPSEQAKQAVQGYQFFGGAPTAAQLKVSPTSQSTAATAKETPAKTKPKESAVGTKTQSVLQGQRKQPATQARAGQLLNTWIQSVLSKKQPKDTDWDWLSARPVLRSYFS